MHMVYLFIYFNRNTALAWSFLTRLKRLVDLWLAWRDYEIIPAMQLWSAGGAYRFISKSGWLCCCVDFLNCSILYFPFLSSFFFLPLCLFIRDLFLFKVKRHIQDLMRFVFSFLCSLFLVLLFFFSQPFHFFTLNSPEMTS